MKPPVSSDNLMKFSHPLDEDKNSGLYKQIKIYLVLIHASYWTGHSEIQSEMKVPEICLLTKI